MKAAATAARVQQTRANSQRVLAAGTNNGLSRWEFENEPSAHERRSASAIVAQWERENRPAWRKAADRLWEQARKSSRTLLLLTFVFTLGFAAASGPHSVAANVQLRERLRANRNVLTAREGELELTRLELSRLGAVMENSNRYRIPADLASKIYDIALAEGIDPKVAFSLVSIESDFTHGAISPKGALGLTQLMPSTARFFEPNIERADLFDPETNLRIGFRFLRELIAKYNGNIDRALTAYNRGPAVVDRVAGESRDPSNGYSSAVLKGATK